jgi:hypothetical protein
MAYTGCLPPRQADAHLTWRCRWFSCAWEFTRFCCWMRVHCRRCGRVAEVWRLRETCPRALNVELNCDISGMRDAFARIDAILKEIR